MANVQSARAAIIMVTNTNDSGPGSLRDALAIANDGDTIDATGVSGTILLTSGELQNTHNVTISGPGANNLAVDGNAQSRVFYVNLGKTVTISDLTITNGSSGIYNDGGALTLSDCTVSGNSGGGIGNDRHSGSGATMTVSNCMVSGNSGRGIVNARLRRQRDDDSHQLHYQRQLRRRYWQQPAASDGSATMTVTNSTISGNSGGGIANLDATRDDH